MSNPTNGQSVASIVASSGASLPTQLRQVEAFPSRGSGSQPEHDSQSLSSTPSIFQNVSTLQSVTSVNHADLRNGIDAGYPLTKTGRKKRGCDEDQDDHDGYAVDPPEDSKHPYKSKSYHIRRAFSLFADIHAIMNDGIKRRAREVAGIWGDLDCIQQPRDYETFTLITSHLDGLDQDIIRLKKKPKVFRKLIRGIRQAADQGRNNDTANLKRDIACMLTDDGSCVLNAVRKGIRSSSKSDRGFYNDVMGRYLCPITLEWDNPREEIRDGKHAIVASKVPRLLYANCECDVDDLELGLGRNQALLRVVKYIFTGRSSAFSPTPGGKTTRAGNAALAGMKEITPRVVAYSACMLRFAISTEESWSKVDNEFNMEEFYWYVVDIFDDAQEFGRSLLAWWNMQVFGISNETARTSSPTTDTDFISLLKKQRAEKRARLGILDETTNVATYFNSPVPADRSFASFLLPSGAPTVVDDSVSHTPHTPTSFRTENALLDVQSPLPTTMQHVASAHHPTLTRTHNATPFYAITHSPSSRSPVTRPPTILPTGNTRPEWQASVSSQLAARNSALYYEADNLPVSNSPATHGASSHVSPGYTPMTTRVPQHPHPNIPQASSFTRSSAPHRIVAGTGFEAAMENAGYDALLHADAILRGTVR